MPRGPPQDRAGKFSLCDSLPPREVSKPSKRPIHAATPSRAENLREGQLQTKHFFVWLDGMRQDPGVLEARGLHAAQSPLPRGDSGAS